MRHVCFTFIFLNLICTSLSCVKYVARNAKVAHDEWVRKQEQEALEQAQEEEYYYYEDASGSGGGSGDYMEDEDEDERQCRPCSDEELMEEAMEENPRFFFNQINSIFTTRRIPCCQTRQEITTMAAEPRERMKNATHCGRKSYQRILGGVITKENEFPWQCAILKPDGSFYGCSAVLLSCDPVIIVSAAHCFPDGAMADDVMVACGAHRISRPDPSPADRFEVRLKVKDIVVHPDFSWLRAHHPILGDNDGHPVGISLFENDIAVIKLEDDTALTCKKKRIWPACLPSMNENYVHWYKTGLAGWGLTLNDGNISSTLQKVNAPVVTDRSCQERVCQVDLGPIKLQNCIIPDNAICAGGMGGRGPCRGDSGGALLAQDRELQGWSAIGIVSYQPGTDCGTEMYVVFTEIRKYLGWLALEFNMLPPTT